LDFHHRSEKLRSVSTMRDLAKASILAEIAKCDVLCGNCHRKNTPHQTRRWEERMAV
jgi:hypothetical protein